MSDEDFIEIIIHGQHCLNWTEPKTNDEWLSLQLTWKRQGEWTYGRCPACGDNVFVQADFGEIEFGT